MKWVSLALVALLAAGCLSQPETRPDYAGESTQAAQLAAPALELDHGTEDGHFQAALHEGAHNLELVGYANGVDDSGNPGAIPATGWFTELAVGTDGFAYLSGFSDDGSFGGLSILNIGDAANPRFVSHFDGLPSVDVEVDPDGDFAYLATQRTDVDSLTVLQRTQDPFAAAPRGIDIVDVSDKRNPTLVGFVPLPVNGPHTLTYVRHPNGDDYLLACTYDLVTDPTTSAIAGVVPLTQRLIVFLVAEDPTGNARGPTLLPVAQYQVFDPQPPGGPLVFPHDARVVADPTDPEQLYLYVAYWDRGVQILDFSHPPASALPPTDQAQSPMLELKGEFDNFYPSAYNNIHLAMAFPERIAGRTITVAEPEIVDAPEETGQISFLDTSDPANPQMLGHWSLSPGGDKTGAIAPELGVRGLDFSPHNFDLWDGKVALAHNHAGVWVIDVSDEENLRDPKAVAFYMPSQPRPDSPVMQPRVWSVVEEGGLLYVSDEATGLYILQYTGP